MKIYISGLYSGTNPQPGLGTARSLRAAYPDAALIGVEYSNRSSGIHWTDFDELLLQRPWEELNLESYAQLIGDVLDSGAYWLSGFDLEIMWLASVFPEGHPRLLTPPRSALARIGKPAVEAHRGLPVSIPPFISAADHSDWELHAFCRRHDWKVWLKGPYYEAVRTHSWDVVESVRLAMNRAWSTQRVFLQTHVTGYEESVCFSAYRGELLGSGYMRKRELTHEGKTWAGEVTEVPGDFLRPLRAIVRELRWTGGAELEMVRDTSGQLWMIECNPRFPAWIHGATIAGRNLPALLVERASGEKARPAPAISEEFTRVVLELPVRRGYPLPPLPEPFAGGFGHSQKHPSGSLAFAERLHKLDVIDSNRDTDGDGGGAPAVPATYIDDLEAQDLAKLETPSWLYLENTAGSLFARAADMAKRVSTPDVRVTNAYSIKTNPDERLIRLARESGFMAEAISLLEVRKALAVGFRTQEVILNGPGKWWPAGLLPETPLYAVFCDSLADLTRVARAMAEKRLRAEIVGVRLRPPNIPSRFGIPADSPDALKALIDAIATLPRQCAFGVHFHMASSNVGVARWWHLYESMLKWCGAIEALSGRRIEHLDLGGGWFPDDWHVDSKDHFADAVQRVRKYAPNVRQIISEPGKAMAQPTMALGMRLLELGGSRGELTDAVVDGSIAELPMNFFQPHRILHRDACSGKWRALRRGKTQLLGRLCMEHDIVASNVELPEGAAVGDLLVFCDAGAYDRSMSYVFGRG
jgi:diaminopimelate decarboxylase